MPKHMQIESGFPCEEVSSIDGDTSDRTSDKSKRRASVLENELLSAKKHRQKLNSTLENVATYLEGKTTATAKAAAKTATATKAEAIKQVADFSRMMVDMDVLDTMSPDSKNTYLTELQTERKQLLKKMSSAASASDDEE